MLQPSALESPPEHWFWTITGSCVINLKHNNGKHTLAHGISATYDDECCTLSAGIYRTNFNKNDGKPKTGFTINVVFKTIGNMITSNSSYSLSTGIGNVE
jgi:hypothetical protein